MKKLSDLKLILMWAIVIPVVLSGCNSHHANVDSSSFDVMVGILKSVSVHPSKIEVITNNHSSGSNASITRKYKSDVLWGLILQDFFVVQEYIIKTFFGNKYAWPS